MKLKVPIFLLLISQSLFAQLPRELIEPTSFVNAFDEYEGSIYESLRFINASVVNEKSGTYEVRLRYNIFTDAIEYKKGDELYNIVKRPSVHARIGEDYFYFCNFKTQRGLKKNGYFILVELNENYRIYKKHILEFTEPGIKRSTLDAITPGKIRSLTNYYIEEKGILMKLPLDKKEILTVFQDKKEELQSYIKSEKIKLRKEEDLIRFVSKYSALKSIESNPSRSLLSNNY